MICTGSLPFLVYCGISNNESSKNKFFFRRIIPIENKPDCQRRYRRAFDTQMGIPPITEFLIPSEILSSDVKSSYKTDSSVNNNDFSVIPVIHTKLQLPKQRRKNSAT